jgi:5-methylcytosine-specific restriction endonuclease McrA
MSKENRNLTSKYLRAVLFVRAKGLCQICGCKLGKGWHADHIIPWSVTKRTNVFEMQATCKGCNLKKGDR